MSRASALPLTAGLAEVRRSKTTEMEGQFTALLAVAASLVAMEAARRSDPEATLAAWHRVLAESLFSDDAEAIEATRLHLDRIFSTAADVMHGMRGPAATH